MHGLLTTTKMMQCFGKTWHYFLLLVVAVGKIPVRLESGESMRSRPESRTSKVSGGLVNFLVY